MLRLWRESFAFRGCTIALLVFLLIVVAPWLYLDWKTERDLQAELDRIRAAGEPLTLAEAAPEPVPDAENAAVLYQQVLGRWHGDTGSVGPSVFEMTGHSQLIERDYLQGRASHAAARTILESRRVEEAFEILRRASNRGRSRLPHTTPVDKRFHFPHAFGMRSAARWLSAKSKLLAHDGRIDEALDWCRVSLRMSEHMGREPSVIAQLVAIAMQAIACDRAEETLNEGAPSPKLAREMAAYAHAIDLDDEFTQALLAERVAQIAVFDQYGEDPEMTSALKHGVEELPESHFDRALFWLYGTSLNGSVVNMDELVYLETMEELIEMARSASVPDRKRGEERLDQTIPGFALMTRIVASVSGRAIDKRDQARANVDLLEIALAAEIYRAEHGGWPADLSALQATLSHDLPEDPFAGAPYHYRREQQGYTLYSVGWDLDDDGGRGPDDPGYDWDNFDIVWRVKR